jgi:transposase
MERFVLTDAQWAKMEPRCLGKPGDPGRSGKDNRLFVEAVLWIVRTGSPWRDLPPSFGNWNSVFTRFRHRTPFRIPFGIRAGRLPLASSAWQAAAHRPALDAGRG